MFNQLGKQEAALLAYAQMRELRTLRTGDLVGPLHLSPLQEARLFDRMTRRKLIAQVRRGLYLVPAKLPLGGAWSPDEALAINTLMDDKQGRYQVSGPSAGSDSVGRGLTTTATCFIRESRIEYEA